MTAQDQVVGLNLSRWPHTTANHQQKSYRLSTRLDKPKVVGERDKVEPCKGKGKRSLVRCREVAVLVGRDSVNKQRWKSKRVYEQLAGVTRLGGLVWRVQKKYWTWL